LPFSHLLLAWIFCPDFKPAHCRQHFSTCDVGAQDNAILNDLWIFSYDAKFWLQVDLPDQPIPRYLPSCAPVSEEAMIVFGVFSAQLDIRIIILQAGRLGSH
jgi:hypothetical protein